MIFGPYELTVTEDVLCGSFLALGSEKLECRAMRSDDVMCIGVAARDFLKGDKVIYDPKYNTKDVNIRSKLL